jgi:predicted ArsR family transcriptional regulator
MENFDVYDREERYNSQEYRTYLRKIGAEMLELLKKSENPVSVSEMADVLGFNSSDIRRCIKEFEEFDWIIGKKEIIRTDNGEKGRRQTKRIWFYLLSDKARGILVKGRG